MENLQKQIEKKERRKDKKQGSQLAVGKLQTKFFVDLSKDQESLDLVNDHLVKLNKKEFGREILFRDLSLYAIGKLTDKDHLKIQESSRTHFEQIQQAHSDYNKQNTRQLTFEEFLLLKVTAKRPKE